MPTTVRIISKTDRGDGGIQIEFQGGRGRTFSDLADLQSQVLGNDDDLDLTQELCLAWWLARSADLSNEAVIMNKDFTFDLSNANPIRVQ